MTLDHFMDTLALVGGFLVFVGMCFVALLSGDIEPGGE